MEPWGIRSQNREIWPHVLEPLSVNVSMLRTASLQAFRAGERERRQFTRSAAQTATLTSGPSRTVASWPRTAVHDPPEKSDAACDEGKRLFSGQAPRSAVFL